MGLYLAYDELQDQRIARSPARTTYYFSTMHPFFKGSHQPDNLLDSLLNEFSDLFDEPTELPPLRNCDHRIYLQPNAGDTMPLFTFAKR